MQVARGTIRGITIFAGVAALLAGAGELAAVSAAPAPATGSWSQPDYNAAQSRANLSEQTLTLATVPRIGYRRSITAAPGVPTGGCSNVGFIAPLLDGGDVYALAEGRLAKYSAATGQQIWQRVPNPNEPGYQSIDLSGGLVIIGEDDCGSVSDPNGSMQAVDAATGAQRWTTPITPVGGALDSAVVSSGDVIAIGHSSGDGIVVSMHNAASGKLGWYHEYNLCVQSGPVLVVGGRVIYSGCTSANQPFLEADSLATGTRDWRRPGSWTLERGDAAGATGSHVYAVAGSQVDDLSAQTGATRFSLAGASSVLAVGGAQTYASCGTSVCGYNLSTGALAWTGNDSSSLAAEAGGVLYLADGAAINASTGATLRNLWPDVSPAASALAVGNGHIAVVNDPRVIDIYGLPGS